MAASTMTYSVHPEIPSRVSVSPVNVDRRGTYQIRRVCPDAGRGVRSPVGLEVHPEELVEVGREGEDLVRPVRGDRCRRRLDEVGVPVLLDHDVIELEGALLDVAGQFRIGDEGRIDLVGALAHRRPKLEKRHRTRHGPPL
jgi:hypothetical protein